jgi:hypothetical protein
MPNGSCLKIARILEVRFAIPDRSQHQMGFELALDVSLNRNAVALKDIVRRHL